MHIQLKSDQLLLGSLPGLPYTFGMPLITMIYTLQKITHKQSSKRMVNQ